MFTNTQNSTQRNTHLNKKICVGVVAHVDAGKTTLTEQFLYKAGILKTIGRVDHKDTVADNLSVEKERGITVRASTLAFPWQDKTIQLLDTPGHVDFIAEVERSLTVLDAAILVLSAKEGVQTQTRVIFSALKRLKIPTLLFINKVDRMGVDLDAIYDDMRRYLSDQMIIMQSVECESTKDVTLTWFSDSEPLIEAADNGLSAQDDDYLTTLIENPESIHPDARFQAIKDQFNQGICFPVLHGAALHGIGIDALLDTVSKLVTFTPEPKLRGRCYKVDRDAAGNRRCFVKLFGGDLVLRESYAINGGDEQIRIRQLSTLEGITPIPKAYASAGDIAIIYDNTLKIEDQITSALCENSYATFNHIAVPTLTANVKFKHLGERRSILQALEILTDEDPFLAYRIHPVTEAIEIKLFGTVQKEIVLALLKERFDIHTDIENPVTLYKEKPAQSCTAKIQMYRETPLPATVGLEVQPLSEGSGFLYETRVSFGDLKKPFQNAVYEGVKKAVEEGVGSWALTDLKVVFTESEYDSVNSTPADYRNLAPDVLRKALADIPLTVLEPLFSYDLELPSYAVGKAISDMLRMRGSVSDPEIVDGIARLHGVVPVDTCKNYLQALFDYTEGKGIFNTQFYGYREMI